MKNIIRFIFAAIIFSLVCGCTSKLVRIDSKPAFADIKINNKSVGKTPMYHRFYDLWYPWPMKKTDDYLIQAQRPGFEPEVQIFHETPVRADISYVPDEIFFKMVPLAPDEDME
ncbi:MAG: hypothetical protein J7K96_00085 [Desulfobacteraceae bacterium]|nr:hypothetical protein [Desulfobacteraceae bacterium]